jgi:beta-glucanase (GH16 family)
MVLKDKVVTKIYFESNILIPDSGNGLWPGFWFFPKEYVYGEYAASGEIDLMELRDGYDSLTCGVHYGGPEKGYNGDSNLRNMTRTFNVDKSSFANKSFVFGAEWTLDTIVFFVNGVEMARRHSKAIDPENGWFSAASNAEISSPFDIPFKAIYNIAVGGNFPKFAPDETTPGEVIMSVDYLRVFADFA